MLHTVPFKSAHLSVKTLYFVSLSVRSEMMTHGSNLTFSRLLYDSEQFNPKCDLQSAAASPACVRFLPAVSMCTYWIRKCLLRSLSTETHMHQQQLSNNTYIYTPLLYYHLLCDSVSVMTCLVILMFLYSGQKWIKLPIIDEACPFNETTLYDMMTCGVFLS